MEGKKDIGGLWKALLVRCAGNGDAGMVGESFLLHSMIPVSHRKPPQSIVRKFYALR